MRATPHQAWWAHTRLINVTTQESKLVHVCVEAGAIVPVDEGDVLKVDWTQFNREQRSKTKTFFQSAPRHRILISSITLAIAVCFLRSVEQVAALKWDLKQWHTAVETGRQTTRMWEAFSGRWQEGVRDHAKRLVGSGEPWQSLTQRGRTWGNSGIACVQVMVALCCLEQLIVLSWRSFPYRLWMLVE